MHVSKDVNVDIKERWVKHQSWEISMLKNYIRMEFGDKVTGMWKGPEATDQKPVEFLRNYVSREVTAWPGKAHVHPVSRRTCF